MFVRKNILIRSIGLLVTMCLLGGTGSAYAADTTAPTITSIVRQSPTSATTDAETVTFRITFSEAVMNVSSGDFALAGTGATKSSIKSVTEISQSIYDVEVETADGILSLVVRTAVDNIEDLAGNDYDDAVGTSESYTIVRPPVITIDADTKEDTVAITDTTVTVTDDTAIAAANVTVDSDTTVTVTDFSCTQVSSTKVTCTMSIDGKGSLVIRAVDNVGGSATATETGYSINTNIEAERPRTKISNQKKKVKLSKHHTTYITKRHVTFSGTNEYLKGGKVKIYNKKEKIGETTISNATGKWSGTIAFRNGRSYKLTFRFYDKHGNKIDTKGAYKIFVDTEKPVFTDLPRKLTKRPGQRIWWKVTDNHKIKRYRYFWRGKKVKTRNAYFVVPAHTPRGTYKLEVRAYDKAGNKADRVVRVTVR